MNARLLGILALGMLPVAADAITFDFNSNGNGFSVVTTGPLNGGPWTWSASAGLGGSGGWYTDGQAAATAVPNTTKLTSPTLTATGSTVGLSFDHRYSFEEGRWDGGAVFLSVNGGAFQQIPGSSFTANPYNGTVLAGSLSELAGRAAFIENSPGYTTPIFLTSTVDIVGLAAGDTFQVQFFAGLDTNSRGPFQPNWEIDNVVFRNASSAVPVPATIALLAIGCAGLAVVRRRNR